MKGRLYKMDKRKYETKTLIAEYQYLSKHEDSRFTETAYKLKDGTKIIEYKGNKLSIYSVMISFNKDIPRSGVYRISDSDYEMWKRIRSRNEDDFFVDWEKEYEDQLNKEYENVLKCVGADELPF